MNKFKKVLTGVSALALAIALLPVFSAFEAHVINVTAKIENALSVPTESLNFGTVFPQEQLEKTLNISLSQSFLDETNADDVEYIIRQKPKCAVTSDNGTTLVGPTWTGHVVPVGPNSNEYTVDCVADAPADLATILQNNSGASAGLLPSLCEYVSKHPDGTPTNDGSLNSFHKPFTVSNGVITWNDVRGRLAKSDQDPADSWTIDLAVPCFGNFCAQDWANYVHGINPDVPTSEANLWTQPIANEHKIFGCNLWVEVTGVSRVGEEERPEVGALITAETYEEPTCDATVQDGQSIQVAIDAATSGQTVCVADGTHDENEYPLHVNKDNLTLAGLNAPTNTADLAGGIIVDNDGVTIKGLKIGNSTALSETFGVYVNTGAENVVIRDNVITGPGVGSGRGIVNAIGTTDGLDVINNVITNWLTGVFLNDSSNMLVDGNTLTGNGVGSGNDNPVNNVISNNIIKDNTIEGVGVLADDAGESVHINSNNIYSNGPTGNDELNSYGDEVVDAEDNWWGDPDSTGDIGGPGVAFVDADPAEVSAFPEN